MSVVPVLGWRATWRRMQWPRGLRAGLAVGAAMVVCLLLNKPFGWATLGALQVIFVDNGGPYRSRFANIVTVMVGGCCAMFLGISATALGPHSLANLPVAVIVTVAFSFTVTLARVISQPFAASSVAILSTYIIAYGNPVHSLDYGISSTGYFLAGGAWAALLSLVLWPADPFRPARNAVAAAYDELAGLARVLAVPRNDATEFNAHVARTRAALETAQTTLAATPARATTRTVRARNLAVLIESADLLVDRILRFAVLTRHAAENAKDSPALQDAAFWLSGNLTAVAHALLRNPDRTSGPRLDAFAVEGSLSVELHRAAQRLDQTLDRDALLEDPARPYLHSVVHDALFNFEVAFEAVRAIWSGSELRLREAAHWRASLEGAPAATAAAGTWLETLHSNLTTRSVMFRHALRMTIVVSVDVALMHWLVGWFPVTHGYWLAMTSIIVLQPFTGETVRKSGQRVLGTVAGAVLASIIAALFPSSLGLLVLITVGTTLAIAVISVDYAWYCFFLTPTIVFMTMPHLHDWHIAIVRTGMTLLGAGVAVLAMLLVWPERESLQLPALLARSAAAEAAYLRATLAYWKLATGRSEQGRIDAERAVLAPARRFCGLASTDAEETLDRALVERELPWNPHARSTEQLNSAGLTFTTFTRRLTRTITTLAAVARDHGCDSQLADLLTPYADRLTSVARAVESHHPVPDDHAPLSDTLPYDAAVLDQLQRLDRQTTVLERTTADLAAAYSTAHHIPAPTPA